MQNKKLLQCGHIQPVKIGAGATWCPICNEMTVVIKAPRPVRAGTRAALALVR